MPDLFKLFQKAEAGIFPESETTLTELEMVGVFIEEAYDVESM